MRREESACPFCGAPAASATEVTARYVPLRIAQVVAAFGVASMASACSAYGKAGEFLFDTATGEVAADTGEWSLPESGGVADVSEDTASNKDAGSDTSGGDAKGEGG